MEPFSISETFLKDVMKEKFRYVIMTAKHITGRQDIAEDCAMMGLMAMWQHRNDFASIKEATAFLYVVTRNFAFNELRSEKMRRERGPNTIEDFIETEYHYEYKDIINKALYKVRGKFNKKDTNIFVSHINGLSNQEISQVFGYKYQTVRNVKSTVLSFLKNAIPVTLLQK